MPAVALARVYRASLGSTGRPGRAWIVAAWWTVYILPGLVLVGELEEHSPKRHAALAGMAAGVDLRAQPRLAISIGAARRCERQSLGKAVVGRRHPERIEIGKAFEDRAHGIARPLRDLHRRRHLRGVAQQRKEGLDDQLLRAFAAQAAAIYSGRTDRHIWQIFFREGLGIRLAAGMPNCLRRQC